MFKNKKISTVLVLTLIFSLLGSTLPAFASPLSNNLLTVQDVNSKDKAMETLSIDDKTIVDEATLPDQATTKEEEITTSQQAPIEKVATGNSTLLLDEPKPAYTPSGTFKDPGTGSDVDTIGTVSWQEANRIQIQTPGGQYAHTGNFKNNNFTHYLRGTKYNFNIPSNAVIKGIQIKINRKASGNNAIKDNIVRLLKNGTPVGEDKAVTSTHWGTSLAEISYGNSSDLWDTQWTVSDIENDDFGVVLSAINNTSNNTSATVDYMQIAVYYTVGDTQAPTLYQVTAVPTPTNDNTPSYTFHSDEAGTINYIGDCTSATTNAVAGNNTITFNTLANGVHSNCKITVTDAASNTSSQLSVNTFTIDTQVPAITELSDIITKEQVTVTANATDASGIASYHWSYVSKANINFGTPNQAQTTISADEDAVYGIRVTVTDNAGNFDTEDFLFTWDTTAPEITSMPIDITEEATGPDGAIVTYSMPQVTDNLDSNPELVCEPNSGTTFPLGETKVTCTATDDAGNTSSASFNVTVEDTTKPIITVNGNDETIEAGAVYTDKGATASDIVDGTVKVITSGADFDTNILGAHKITYTATDKAGNTAEATRVVTVVDTTAPIGNITLLSDYINNANQHNFSFTVKSDDAVTCTYQFENQETKTGVVPTCNINAITDNVDLSYLDEGEVRLEVTIKDASNNATTLTAKLTKDTIAPVVNVGDNVYTNKKFTKTAKVDEKGTGIASYEWTDESKSISNLVFGTPNELTTTISTKSDGTYYIRLIATDVAGNMSDNSGDDFILVWDTVAPTIDSVNDILVNTANELGTEVTIIPPMSHDAVDGDLVASCNYATGLFPVGITTVTCSKTDKSGNIAQPVSFKVIVESSNVDGLVNTDTKDAKIYQNAGTETGVVWVDQNGNTLFSYSTNVEYAKATIGSHGVTKYLRGGNYGFNVPKGATINGIQVLITRETSGDAIRESSVKLVKNGTILSEDKAVTDIDWSISSNKQVYGSLSDLWGITWTAEEINSPDFQVALLVNNNSSESRTAKVTSMQIAVNYTPDITPPVLTAITGPFSTNDNTPDYKFNSSEKGKIYLSGNCNSSRRDVIVGDNTITLQAGNSLHPMIPLADGYYDTCIIKIADGADNYSNELQIGPFIIDTAEPVITLIGDNPVQLYAGDTYIDAGATVTDNYDNNLTATIDSSAVNTNVVGTYVVTFDAVDTAGNHATQITRTVNVIQKPSIGSVIFGSTIVPAQAVLGEKISDEGKWVKTDDASAVYYVDTENIRHAYPSEAVWYSYFGKDFSFVETISKDELVTYSLGKNVQFKSGSLIKVPSVLKVYLVGEDFSVQWITTEDAAIRLYGADWSKLVYDIDESFFGDYVIGSDIE